MLIGSSSFVCSASLVKPGIVVTAAHCVASFGNSQFYNSHQFVPAYQSGNSKFGVWTASSLYVMTSYFNGSESCAVRGVVCPNDVAVIVLAPQRNAFPGARTGWYGYGWNGYGFNNSNQALITQLGYPVALDGGQIQERTDSQSAVVPSFSNNNIIGSLQTGGSSGGPWLANFGFAPSLSGISFGAEANRNVVIGVTSWGYTDSNVKTQGASPFTTGNITILVDTACGAWASRC